MWDSLSAEDKKMYIKQADVFAAYTAYADDEIGRLIAEIQGGSIKKLPANWALRFAPSRNTAVVLRRKWKPILSQLGTTTITFRLHEAGMMTWLTHRSPQGGAACNPGGCLRPCNLRKLQPELACVAG
jgi:hypothetical protein